MCLYLHRKIFDLTPLSANLFHFYADYAKIYSLNLFPEIDDSGRFIYFRGQWQNLIDKKRNLLLNEFSQHEVLFNC